MRKLVVFLFIFSCFTYSWAQSVEQSWVDNFKFSLYGGPNYSRLFPPADSILVKAGVSPFFGISIINPSGVNNQIHFGGIFFLKSSMDNRQIKYRNVFVGLNFDYFQYVSKGVYFTVGPQYSILLKDYSLNGAVKTPMEGYNSYFSINAGIDLRLQSHLNMGLIYEFPILNSKLDLWPSIKIKFSVIIDDKTFKVKEKQKQKKYANTKLQELKKTALLVRLRGYRKQIEAAESVGNVSRANMIKQKRDDENLSIMNAFESEFDFCPVYFFYNFDTKKIREKDFNHLFINKNLQIDSTIQFDLDTFLIGELGSSELDTVTIEIYDAYPSYKIRSEKRDYRTTDFSNFGFSIRNQDFFVLPKPFPRFISGYFAFVKKTNQGIIRKLNEELHKFNRTY